MLTLTEQAKAEIEVKKSRFISIAYPAKTMQEVKESIAITRELYRDATHVVHAAIIGKSGTEYSCSDDREPKNTAGRPALEVLKGSGITNICVCIVRYFGGTLLGTGGLVKAYGDSAKEVLKNLKTEELIERSEFTLLLPYDLYTPTKRILSEYRVININEDFGEGIKIGGEIESSLLAPLKARIIDISNGRIELR